MKTSFDFGAKYTNRNPVQRVLIDGFYRALGELAHARPVGAALEVGCGEGYSTSRIRAALPAAVRLRACDVDAELVRRAAVRNPDVPVGIASIYRLPYATHSIDLVICLEVLEHLEDPASAYRELLRVCGGALIVSVPREPMFRLCNLARLRDLRRLGNVPSHIQHWSARGFLRFLERDARVLGLRLPFPWTMALVAPEARA